MFWRNVGLYSISNRSSSASRKWRGKERGDVLQALTAQVRKLMVRIFMVGLLVVVDLKTRVKYHSRCVQSNTEGEEIMGEVGENCGFWVHVVVVN